MAGRRQKAHAASKRHRCSLGKKNNENHINADQGHKLIHSYQVTDAAVHDSQVFDALLDKSEDKEGCKRPVFADSAYRSEAKERELLKQGIPSQINEKGTRNHPLTHEQKADNREKSRVRSRVEHVFGTQAHMGRHVVRTVGFKRAAVKIGLMNRVYNMVRLGQLLKRDGRGAPVVA